MFEKLAAAGYGVHGFDAHGHGRSEPLGKEDRAYISKFDFLVDDVYAFVEAEVVPIVQPGSKLFIGGQSLGGLVSAHSVLRKPQMWSGLILHSAALDVVWTPILRVQALVGSLIAALVPRAAIVPAVRPEDM